MGRGGGGGGLPSEFMKGVPETLVESQTTAISEQNTVSYKWANVSQVAVTNFPMTGSLMICIVHHILHFPLPPLPFNVNSR